MNHFSQFQPSISQDNALSLFSRKYGSGKPIVILHGLFGMSDNWVSFASRFQDAFEVHILDLRNHGQSPHSDEFNYDFMALDVVQYCKQNRLENSILVGHSMGGKLAMHIAMLYPGFIEKLIVIDMAPRYYAPHHTHIIEALENLNLQVLQSRNEALEKLMIDDESTKQFLLKNLYRTHNEKSVFAWRFNLKSIKQNIAEIGRNFEYSEEQKLNTKNFKTLFIKGSKSSYINEDDLISIPELFYGAKVIEVKDAGHWVHADKPMELHEIMQHFITAG